MFFETKNQISKLYRVMMPTFNEVLYDYNPYFHACKFCIRHTGYIMKRGFGVVQKVRIKYIGHWGRFYS